MRWRLPRSERLSDSGRIAEIRRHGRRQAGRLVQCFVGPNHLPFNRVAVTVVAAPSSMMRHYVRRRLLELYRTNKHLVQGGFDIVVRFQYTGKKHVTFSSLRADLLEALAAVNAPRN